MQLSQFAGIGNNCENGETSNYAKIWSISNNLSEFRILQNNHHKGRMTINEKNQKK